MLNIRLLRQTRKKDGSDQIEDLFSSDGTSPIQTKAINHRDDLRFEIQSNERQFLFPNNWHLYFGDAEIFDPKSKDSKQPIFKPHDKDEITSGLFSWFFLNIRGTVSCRLDCGNRTIVQWDQEVGFGDDKEIIADWYEIENSIGELSYDLFLDIFGKGSIRIGREFGSPCNALIELNTLSDTIKRLESACHRILNKPHCRMVPRRTREAATTYSHISELCLTEISSNPDILFRRGKEVFFRENIVEVSSPSHNLSENRMILEFLYRLKNERFRVLERKLIREQEHLQEQKKGMSSSWDDYKKIEKTLIRIETMSQDLGRHKQSAHSLLHRMSKAWNIDTIKPLSRKPVSTPLIKKHQGYADAHRLICDYLSRFHVDLSNTPTQSADMSISFGILDLARLYEYWCHLHIVTVLNDKLRLNNKKSELFDLLIENREERLKARLSNDGIEFTDKNNMTLRLYYEKKYYSKSRENPFFGRTDKEKSFYWPDFSLEIFSPNDRMIPKFIVFFDAKFSIRTHEAIYEELSKYHNIDVFDTNTPDIKKQIWGMTTANAAQDNNTIIPGASVEKKSFWRRNDKQEALGAIQVRPSLEKELGQQSPFRQLIDLIFKRLGIEPIQ